MIMLFDIVGRTIDVQLYNGLAGSERMRDFEEALLPPRSSKKIASSFSGFCLSDSRPPTDEIVIRAYDMKGHPELIPIFHALRDRAPEDLGILAAMGLDVGGNLRPRWENHKAGGYKTHITSTDTVALIDVDTYSVKVIQRANTTAIRVMLPRLLLTPQFVHELIYDYVCSTSLSNEPKSLLVHGAGIIIRDEGYLICAASGGGKTTLCRTLGDGVNVLSDEATFVYIDSDGRVMIAGSPWIGRELTFSATNYKALLAKIVFLTKQPDSTTRTVPRVTAAVRLLQHALVGSASKQNLQDELFAMASHICRSTKTFEASIPIWSDPYEVLCS